MLFFRVRLLEEDVTAVSTSSIFEQQCVARGTSMDLLIPQFAQNMVEAQVRCVRGLTTTLEPWVLMLGVTPRRLHW